MIAYLQTLTASILDESVVILFLDQCHLIWDDARGHAWGPSAKRVEIPMTNFRERQTYYGALELLQAELIVIPTDIANGSWTSIFVEYLREQYPGKRLILFWDGASYHRGVEMQEYLEGANIGRHRDEWPITCILFAPHAPEQNPIEGVWLKAKQYLRKNWRQCRTFQDVTRLFEEALNTLSFCSEKLHIYTPDLQII